MRALILATAAFLVGGHAYAQVCAPSQPEPPGEPPSAPESPSRDRSSAESSPGDRNQCDIHVISGITWCKHNGAAGGVTVFSSTPKRTDYPMGPRP